MKKIITSTLSLLLIFVTFFMFGCKNNKEEEVLKDVKLNELVVEVIENAGIDNTDWGTYEFSTKEEAAGIVGTESFESNFTKGIKYTPSMGFSFEFAIFEASSIDEATALKAEIEKEADPNKWICATAESVKVVTKANLVLFVMATEERATNIVNAFNNYNFK